MLPPEVGYLAKTRSIIPVTVDKIGLIKWREFQFRRMTLDELEQFELPAWV